MVKMPLNSALAACPPSTISRIKTSPATASFVACSHKSFFSALYSSSSSLLSPVSVSASASASASAMEVSMTTMDLDVVTPSILEIPKI